MENSIINNLNTELKITGKYETFFEVKIKFTNDYSSLNFNQSSIRSKFFSSINKLIARNKK